MCIDYSCPIRESGEYVRWISVINVTGCFEDASRVTDSDGSLIP
jgi:hypothetical protein